MLFVSLSLKSQIMDLGVFLEEQPSNSDIWSLSVSALSHESARATACVAPVQQTRTLFHIIVLAVRISAFLAGHLCSCYSPGPSPLGSVSASSLS